MKCTVEEYLEIQYKLRDRQSILEQSLAYLSFAQDLNNALKDRNYLNLNNSLCNIEAWEHRASHDLKAGLVVPDLIEMVTEQVKLFSTNCLSYFFGSNSENYSIFMRSCALIEEKDTTLQEILPIITRWNILDNFLDIFIRNSIDMCKSILENGHSMNVICDGENLLFHPVENGKPNFESNIIELVSFFVRNSLPLEFAPVLADKFIATLNSSCLFKTFAAQLIPDSVEISYTETYIAEQTRLARDFDQKMKSYG
jgi:hypothetical protein